MSTGLWSLLPAKHVSRAGCLLWQSNLPEETVSVPILLMRVISCFFLHSIFVKLLFPVLVFHPSFTSQAERRTQHLDIKILHRLFRWILRAEMQLLEREKGSKNKLNEFQISFLESKSTWREVQVPQSRKKQTRSRVITCTRRDVSLVTQGVQKTSYRVIFLGILSDGTARRYHLGDMIWRRYPLLCFCCI